MPRPLPEHVVAFTGGSHDAVRDLILDAALRVIERDGLAAAYTRAIAEEAGLAAGTLYNYFDNRRQLLVRALFRRMHVASAPLGDIPSHAGKDTVAGNLREFARLVGDILEQLVPLFAAAFSDAGLLVALRQELQVVRGPPAGPFAPHPVETYLLAERDLGRIAPDADCRAAAALFVSLCHDRAFHRLFSGHASPPRPLDAELDLIAHALSAPRA